jgi:hypothetical protein
MSGSTDQHEAWLDRECERIMKMSVEEMATEEGLTVEELLEEGGKLKERMLERLSRQFPEFAKKARR